ncbi:MAG: hypothetical protein GXN96_04060 [Aquificae bacterium]|nr:hypothetical protein [Aquificota bacterium]
MSKKLLLTAIFGAGILILPAQALEELSEEELAKVTAKGYSTISNRDDNDNLQNNNNDSVQLNNNAQQQVIAFAVMNIASTAANQTANLGIITETTGDADVEQYATQYAENSVDMSEQTVNNSNDPDAPQNNNNASVQLNGNAQQYATAFHIMNSTNTAANQSTQGAFVADTGGNVTVYQEALQVALNDTIAGQSVRNRGTPSDTGAGPQDNNNASVQLSNNAQQEVVAFTIANTAGVAVNQSANLAFVTDTTGDVDVEQYAIQYAENTISVGQLNVNNDDIDGVQNNNNGSVQLSNNAQQAATAFQMMNAASSAANQSANIAAVSATGGDASIVQSSTQAAINVNY